MKLLYKNIKSLCGILPENTLLLSGKEMNNIHSISDAWLAVEDGKIADFGEMKDWPGISDWRDLEIIDATGKFILPAWCDSHTHIVYASSRASEFEDRIKGFTYEQIAERGGGIINSAKKLALATENELFESASCRISEVIKLGTGAIEIKSGYGLTTEAELKMLRVIRRLRESFPVTIKSTFLGAHAFPSEYKNNREAYIDLIIREMLPAIAAENLADFVDVFCEKNYFSSDDTHRILEAAAKYNLTPKIHVNQFNSIGGVQVGVKHNARSVDHLEVMTEEDVEALKNCRTMPVALPGCSLFIKIPYTPGRQIIDSGLPLALATDYNPGSAPSGNMNLVVSLACINMNLTPAEAINAATINGAYAMNTEAITGSITIGKNANIILTKDIESPAEIPYSFGQSVIEEVRICGRKY